MIKVEPARSKDSAIIEQLISEYHESEGIIPLRERIAWAVNLALTDRFPGILLVALDNGINVGVALATYSPSAELGRVLTVNDFYVKRASRRKGVGRQLAKRLVEEAREMQIDRIVLEVLPRNRVASQFWEAVGFTTEGRRIYSLGLRR